MTTAQLAEAALEYANRGWPVFPLQGLSSCKRPERGSLGKHPRTLHGLNDAATEPRMIRGWWQRWPAANIGVRTGVEAGILVVDVDSDHAGVLEASTAASLTYTTRIYHRVIELPSGRQKKARP